LNNSVLSILPVGTELYAAGAFITSGTDTLNYIAKWNGFAWTKLSRGFNDIGTVLCYDNGLLYAGGYFTEAGGNPANSIAVWNGSTWSPVGSGFNHILGHPYVSGLAAADGRLYAFGKFDHAGVTEINNAGFYDGASWQPLGRGIEGLLVSPNSLFIDYRGVSDYDIYFSGGFSFAGGKPSYNIAKYCVTTVDVNEDESYPEEFSLLQNYPNPFNPVTSIEYRVGSRETVTLKIYDVLGKEVAVLINEEIPAGEYNIKFNAGNLSSGVYFYQLKAGRYLESKKMMLLK
jgi:hypothetical protein